jgi:hypothetical protein
MIMAKKKKYVPRKDDNWNLEADKEHKRVLAEKEKKIIEKYRRWWDDEKKGWKKDFDGH